MGSRYGPGRRYDAEVAQMSEEEAEGDDSRV